MNETVFDKILSGELPAEKVYENDVVCAFKDIAPRAPVHVLVIPKNRITCFAELSQWSQQEVGQFFHEVANVAKELGLNESGYRIIFNNGKDGRQEVDYLHAHILGGIRLSLPTV